MVDNEVILTEIIKISNNLNNFQIQTAKQFEEVRKEIKENKIEIQKLRETENEHWQENLRRWAENDKRWEENKKQWEQNNKRWEENDKRWEQNEKRWNQYEINRKKDKDDLMDAILRYDISISTKLGDPKAQKMKKLLNF